MLDFINYSLQKKWQKRSCFSIPPTAVPSELNSRPGKISSMPFSACVALELPWRALALMSVPNCARKLKTKGVSIFTINVSVT